MARMVRVVSVKNPSRTTKVSRAAAVLLESSGLWILEEDARPTVAQKALLAAGNPVGAGGAADDYCTMSYPELLRIVKEKGVEPSSRRKDDLLRALGVSVEPEATETAPASEQDDE